MFVYTFWRDMQGCVAPGKGPGTPGTGARPDALDPRSPQHFIPPLDSAGRAPTN
jgi:hypothetical protein